MFLKILLDKITQLTIFIIEYLKISEDSPKWLQSIFFLMNFANALFPVMRFLTNTVYGRVQQLVQKFIDSLMFVLFFNKLKI